MPDRPFPDVPGVTHRHVQAGDVKLHVAEAGEGPPVVLVHGWPQHWYAWRKVIPILAKDHHVVAMDLRGFGWSEAPPSAYTKEEMAADIVALLGALDLGPVRLAGHDWGGFAGFLAALHAPDRLTGYAGFSILHPWTNVPLTPRTLSRAFYQLILAPPGLGRLVQSKTGFVELAFKKSGEDGVRTPAEREEFVAAFREPARAEAASRVYRTFLTKERAALSKGAYDGQRFAIPVRLVAGTEDPVIGEPVLAGFEGHGDDAVVERMPGGHWLPEQHPEAVAERIAALPGPS